MPAPFTSLVTRWLRVLRHPRRCGFFHVDAESITLAVLSQLARRGEVKPEALDQAVEKYRLDFPVSTALSPTDP